MIIFYYHKGVLDNLSGKSSKTKHVGVQIILKHTFHKKNLNTFFHINTYKF